jgi:dihydrofolate synthase/folylpolyglutamate synthase
MPKPDVQQYLEGLGRFGMVFGLGRVRKLLASLGDPHKAFPCVHVTGSNGKGSVSKMLACILQEAGYRTGLYVSPHLEKFNERVSVNGVDISDRDLEESLAKVRPLVEAMAKRRAQCTYFEATTAVAFDYFRKANVDVAIIEVGLGGRLDATNVVDPLVSVITNVSLEHTDILGKTLEKIAYEKAGIIKPGRPVVTGAWDRKAVDLIWATANKKKAPFYMMQREVRRRSNSVTPEGQTFSLYTDRESYMRLFTPMMGEFQQENAAVAVLAAEMLGESGLHISPENIRKGIAKAVVPCRMERAGDRPRILLDSAHNPAAARTASRTVAWYRKEGGFERVHLLFGILDDKDLANVLKPMLELADTLTYTQPTTGRALTVEKARKKVTALAGKKGLSFVSSPENALRTVRKLAGKKDLVWVTGSMYLVGEVRALLRKERLIKD